MLSTANNLLNDLDEQLRFLNLEMGNPIQVAETAISITIKSIEKLKSNILKHKFANQLVEILFLKKNKTIIPFKTYILQPHLHHRNV